MDNGGQWQIFDNIEQWQKVIMVDNEIWWTRNYGGQWRIRNNRYLWKITNDGKWTLLGNEQWWTTNYGG